MNQFASILKEETIRCILNRIMSSQTEDFLVVNEDQKPETEDVLNELLDTVHLFGKSINALNESTLLLKDELQRTLSAALSRLEGSQTETTEEILKAFHKSAKSDETIRSDYIKRICARLVSVEAERQKLEVECNKLKAAQYLSNANTMNTAEQQQELLLTSKTVDKIESLLSKLTTEKSDEAEVSKTKVEPTLTDIHERLKSVYERMVQIFNERQVANKHTIASDLSWYDILGDLNKDQTSDDKHDKQMEGKCENRTEQTNGENEMTSKENIDSNDTQHENKSLEHEAEQQQQQQSQNNQGQPQLQGMLESQLETLIAQTVSRIMSRMPGSWNHSNMMMMSVPVPKVTQPQIISTNETGSTCNRKTENHTVTTKVADKAGTMPDKNEKHTEHFQYTPPMPLQMLPHEAFARCPPRGPFNDWFRPPYSGPFPLRMPFNRNRCQSSPRPRQHHRYPSTGSGPQTNKNAETGRNRPQDNKKEPIWIPDFIFD